MFVENLLQWFERALMQPVLEHFLIVTFNGLRETFSPLFLPLNKPLAQLV